jgi:hypothetical protein
VSRRRKIVKKNRENREKGEKFTGTQIVWIPFNLRKTQRCAEGGLCPSFFRVFVRFCVMEAGVFLEAVSKREVLKQPPGAAVETPKRNPCPSGHRKRGRSL